MTTTIPKTLRGFIKQQAAQAQMWADLHEQVENIRAADKAVEQKKQEVADLDEKASKLQGILDDANAQAEDIVERAREKLRQATARSEDAENAVKAAGREAASIIEKAKAEAHEIVTEGKNEAKRVTKLINQIKDARL